MSQSELRIVPPISLTGSKYYRSRLIVNEDGTTTPVLVYLAQRRYGGYNIKTHRPFWIDGDFTHEEEENVGLVEVGVDASPRPRRSSYGVPSGTLEYQRKYREANRERLRGYARKYAARVRATSRLVGSLEGDLRSLIKGLAVVRDGAGDDQRDSEGAGGELARFEHRAAVARDEGAGLDGSRDERLRSVAPPTGEADPSGEVHDPSSLLGVSVQSARVERGED